MTHRYRYLLESIAAAFLLSACATSRPTMSYVEPTVTIMDAQTLANDTVAFLADPLPPARTTLFIDPPVVKGADALTATIVPALRARGYGVSLVDQKTGQASGQGVLLRYIASSLDSGLLLRLQYLGVEASRYYPRSYDSSLLPGAPFTVRGGRPVLPLAVAATAAAATPSVYLGAPIEKESAPFILVPSQGKSGALKTADQEPQKIASVGDDLSKTIARKVAAISDAPATLGAPLPVKEVTNKVPSSVQVKSIVQAPAEDKAREDHTWPTLRIGYGESPLIAIKRWAAPRGYTNVITDLSDGSKMLNIKLNRPVEKGQNYSDTLDASLAEMSESFAKENKAQRFYVSKLTDEKTIVIHDKGLGREAKSFKVQPGSLMDNAYRLAEMFGWQTNINSWLDDTPNPDISTPFNIYVFNDPLDAFKKLFAQYQVQAQLVQGTNEVYFVKPGN